MHDQGRNTVQHKISQEVALMALHVRSAVYPCVCDTQLSQPSTTSTTLEQMLHVSRSTSGTPQVLTFRPPNSSWYSMRVTTPHNSSWYYRSVTTPHNSSWYSRSVTISNHFLMVLHECDNFRPNSSLYSMSATLVELREC